jgi:N-acyl-D-amino-acid deacylase
MRTLFKNGLIIDGTGAKGFKGSVALEGECITAIGEIPEQDGDQVIEAEGLVIAPGFIDTHSHSDLQILVDPFIEPKIRQGVTTEILGQDGISMAPLPKQYITPWRKNLAGLDGDSDQIDWEYETTAGYLALIESRGPGLNQGYLVPHGNVRMEALGLENREPTSAELRQMQDIVAREMEAGALGLSSGLIYIPCAYSETEELIALCSVVARYNGVFVVHQRSEADDILRSMEEVIEIGRRTGVKIHFSHFKVCGRKNWQYIDQTIELLESAQKEGLKISFDQYPYVAGSTMLGVILPPWAHDGGTDKLLKRLEDPELRQKMIRDIQEGIPGWDNFIDFAGLDQIFITSVKTAKNQELVGKNLLEIGELRGKDPYNATFDLLYEEENAVGMVDFYGTEEHVIRFLTRPEQNVCTDGLLGGKPHPRVYGSFPRVLGRYVREEKALTLEDAVYKMTGKPAEVFELTGRGILKTGNYADIVVFNPDTVMDKGTFLEPMQYPEGIEYVMINGRLVLQQGHYDRIAAGKVLRKRCGERPTEGRESQCS